MEVSHVILLMTYFVAMFAIFSFGYITCGVAECPIYLIVLLVAMALVITASVCFHLLDCLQPKQPRLPPLPVQFRGCEDPLRIEDSDSLTASSRLPYSQSTAKEAEKPAAPTRTAQKKQHRQPTKMNIESEPSSSPKFDYSQRSRAHPDALPFDPSLSGSSVQHMCSSASITTVSKASDQVSCGESEVATIAPSCQEGPSGEVDDTTVRSPIETRQGRNRRRRNRKSVKDSKDLPSESAKDTSSKIVEKESKS